MSLVASGEERDRLEQVSELTAFTSCGENTTTRHCYSLTISQSTCCALCFSPLFVSLRTITLISLQIPDTSAPKDPNFFFVIHLTDSFGHESGIHTSKIYVFIGCNKNPHPLPVPI